jgi:hypothetical protein
VLLQVVPLQVVPLQVVLPLRAAPAWTARYPDSADVDRDDLDLLDPVWSPPHRVNRLTILLAGGLVAALGFAGGVLVQKYRDAGLAAGGSAAMSTAARQARANGFGSQGSGPESRFAGTRVTVRVPAGTPVTTTSLTGLRPGRAVSSARRGR